MLLDQRRGSIREFIETKGFVTLHEIAESVGVSESTVRRDLEYLDRTGQIRRTRGGAAGVGEGLPPFDERENQSPGEKQRIGRKVAELIQPGETILIDGGTTTLHVAKHLAGKGVQVVTNSIPIINQLMSVAGVDLVVLGGYLFPRTGVVLGPLTVGALQNLKVRRLIFSVGGITEAGLFNQNSLLVDTQKQMLDAADEVILATDSSKFGHSELVHLCPLDQVDKLVVDNGLSDEWRRIVEKNGIELVVAE